MEMQNPSGPTHGPDASMAHRLRSLAITYFEMREASSQAFKAGDAARNIGTSVLAHNAAVSFMKLASLATTDAAVSRMRAMKREGALEPTADWPTHRTFEVLGHGFDGATSATDDRVYWVKARSSVDVWAALAGTHASYCETIEGDADVDFRLPQDADKLKAALALFEPLSVFERVYENVRVVVYGHGGTASAISAWEGNCPTPIVTLQVQDDGSIARLEIRDEGDAPEHDDSHEVLAARLVLRQDSDGADSVVRGFDVVRDGASDSTALTMGMPALIPPATAVVPAVNARAFRADIRPENWETLATSIQEVAQDVPVDLVEAVRRGSVLPVQLVELERGLHHVASCTFNGWQRARAFAVLETIANYQKPREVTHA